MELYNDMQVRRDRWVALSLKRPSLEGVRRSLG